MNALASLGYLLFPIGIVCISVWTSRRNFIFALLITLAFSFCLVLALLAMTHWLELPNDAAKAIPERYRMAYQIVGTPVLGCLMLTAVRFFGNGYTLRPTDDLPD